MTLNLRRCVMTAVVAVLVAIHAASTVTVRAQQAVFRSSADTVAVDVAVHDGNKPIATFTVPDFELRDNGVVQTIATVTYGTLPIDVRMFADLSSSITPDQLARHETAIRELQTALTPEDRCEVSTFARRITQVAALQAPPVAMIFRRPAIDGTSYFDAAVLSMITAARPGRRQLTMLLTDGLDTGSFFKDDAVLDAARRTDAVVYAVVALNQNARANAKPSIWLANAVAPTGGQTVTIPVGGDIGPALAKIVNEFRQSYVLNYTPANVPHDGWHAITVTVPKHKSYTIRARQGYFGG